MSIKSDQSSFYFRFLIQRSPEKFLAGKKVSEGLLFVPLKEIGVDHLIVRNRLTIYLNLNDVTTLKNLGRCLHRREINRIFTKFSFMGPVKSTFRNDDPCSGNLNQDGSFQVINIHY